MSGVTIAATFAKKEAVRNGLTAIAKPLIEEQPPGRHYVVGVIECLRFEVDRTSGDARTPAVKFVAIEAALTDDDIADLRRVFERRYMDRTGQGVAADGMLPGLGGSDEDEDAEDAG
jgi:hypothetical protein